MCKAWQNKNEEKKRDGWKLKEGGRGRAGRKQGRSMKRARHPT
uniref:Uncharacterized protein n=1 Tax=Setaria italica TaxID=4555 RepID=K3Z1H0_SETIT